MKPNYDVAATKAMEILISNNVTETPISALPILLQYPCVRVVPFTKMADEVNKQRSDLVPMFGTNQDAATFHLGAPGINDAEYIVVYNMRLPIEIIHRAVARELGHIVLGHDGKTRPMDVRMKEAMCFAHHLLTPRPIIHMLQESGTPVTMNVLTATTGCSDECVDDMRNIPGAKVPKEINLQVKKQFEPHIKEYIQFHASSPRVDRSPVVDFGTFMEEYEE